MKRYLPVKTLFKEAALSIFIPHKTFARIPKKLPIDYKKLIPILFILGFIQQTMLLPSLHNAFFFHLRKIDVFIVILVPFFSVGAWALGSLFFYYLGKIFKRDIPLKRVEIATFYLWFVWFLMPLFDLVHIPLGTHFVIALFWDVEVHLSWFFALPVLICETFFLLKKLLGLDGKKILLIAALAPVIDRFGLGSLPSITKLLFSTYIPYSQTVDYFLLVTPTASVFIFFLWLTHKRKFTAIRAIVQTTVTCLLVFALSASIVVTNLPHASNGRKVAGPFFGKSHPTHSYTFTSSDLESGTQTYTDGTTHDRWWTTDYTGVTLDFTPANETIKDIQVKVHIVSTSNFSGAMKMQGCYQANNTGNFYCSEWATPSAGYMIFTISPTSIRNYVLGTNGNATDGLGSEDTTADWNTLVSNIATSNNNIKVHALTDYTTGGQGGGADSVQFDEAYLIVDYLTDLYSFNWQFFQNSAASYTPSTSLASVNTTATNVHRNDIVRLRMTLRVGDKDLAVNDEKFKLQYAAMSGANCAASQTWHDVAAVGSTTSPWVAHHNASLTAGTTLPSNETGVGTVVETYEESNNSAINPTAIAIATTDKGEWDWSLQNYLANPNTTYCFQMVAATDGSGNALSVNNMVGPYTGSSTYAPALTTANDIINLQGKVNLQGAINLQ